MIRVASEEDLPAIARLAAILWPSEDESILLGEFNANHGSPDHALYISEEDNEVIGFIELSLRNDYVEGTFTSPVAYIEAIFVKEQYRKQRVGIALVQQAEEWARKKGCSELASDTEISNIASQNFHRQCGFEEANRIVAFVKTI
jgi:aminoglycoside 6'-N-acetyltransferase I